jgi:two-component system sensor histidine kinase RegB
MLSHVLPKPEISTLQNLKWLFILRNMMILGECFLVVMFVYALDIRIPEQQLWLVIVAIIAFNGYTSMRLQTDDPVTEMEIFSQICIDVFSIAALLYLTGGASNPITWVFLLPLSITAIMLPQAYAWYMVILTTSMYSILIAFNVPLPSIEPHMPDPGLLHPSPNTANFEMLQKAHAISDNHYYNLHMFGMWFGFVFSAGLVAFFVAELAKTLKNRERSLAEARENALRDERVVALGTLAASAAHDMGTPLGTIAIVIHELIQDYPARHFPEFNEKMEILQNQVNRCKDTLSLISASAGEMRAESGKAMLLTDYIDNVLYQWRSHKPTAKLQFIIDPDIVVDAQIIAERTLTHALINILNNAVEASSDPDRGIEFHARWNVNELSLKIRDFGPGFPAEIVKFVGKQPVTSKNKGLGVGLFLAYSTIHRLGGKISLNNLETGGACVEISLPLLTDTKNDDDF